MNTSDIVFAIDAEIAQLQALAGSVESGISFLLYGKGRPSHSMRAILTDMITWEPCRSYSSLVNQVTGIYVAPNYPYAVAGDFYDDNGRDRRALIRAYIRCVIGSRRLSFRGA